MSLQKLWMQEAGHRERGEEVGETTDVVITGHDEAESQRRKIVAGEDKENPRGGIFQSDDTRFE